MSLIFLITQKVQQFWFGFTLPLRAMKLILSKPKLIFWSLIPIVLTVFVYLLMITRLQFYIRNGLIQVFLQWGWNPNGWGSHLIIFLTQTLFILIGAVTFSSFANLIACPFNDYLAEKAERYTSPPSPSFEKSILLRQNEIPRPRCHQNSSEYLGQSRVVLNLLDTFSEYLSLDSHLFTDEFSICQLSSDSKRARNQSRHFFRAEELFFLLGLWCGDYASV